MATCCNLDNTSRQQQQQQQQQRELGNLSCRQERKKKKLKKLAQVLGPWLVRSVSRLVERNCSKKPFVLLFIISIKLSKCETHTHTRTHTNKTHMFKAYVRVRVEGSPRLGKTVTEVVDVVVVVDPLGNWSKAAAKLSVLAGREGNRG